MKTSKKAAKQTTISSPVLFNVLPAKKPSISPAPASKTSATTSDMEDTGLDAEEREIQEAFAKAQERLKEVRRRKEEREAAKRAREAAEKEAAAKEARAKELGEVARRRSSRNPGIANEVLGKHGTFMSLLGQMISDGEREVLGMFLGSWTKDLRGSLGVAAKEDKPKKAIKLEPGLEERTSSGVRSAMNLVDDGEEEESEDEPPRSSAKRRKTGGLVRTGSTIPVSAAGSGSRDVLSDIE
ncbi:hypothetical protein BJ508DRAFT_361719 [Ascobolus immersus RN42]|uniref:Uncharacterized protein n=1 Tax=Ascobolus immersus RN42 TaxID=1160509 RepID=A0A3N4I8A5_ASCIM|nr:hypothetical protein BJ508DRAFT_361719 [Ascobolus immersus RN42]